MISKLLIFSGLVILMCSTAACLTDNVKVRYTNPDTGKGFTVERDGEGMNVDVSLPGLDVEIDDNTNSTSNAMESD